MICGKRLVIIMPAYNAERTLRKTFQALPHDIVDDLVLTDDASTDCTLQVAKTLGIRVLGEPLPNSLSECNHGSKTVRVPHGIPRVFPQSAQNGSTLGEL